MAVGKVEDYGRKLFLEDMDLIMTNFGEFQSRARKAISNMRKRRINRFKRAQPISNFHPGIISSGRGESEPHEMALSTALTEMVEGLVDDVDIQNILFTSAKYVEKFLEAFDLKGLFIGMAS